jgi:hypothetical protein
MTNGWRFFIGCAPSGSGCSALHYQSIYLLLDLHRSYLSYLSEWVGDQGISGGQIRDR